MVLFDGLARLELPSDESGVVGLAKADVGALGVAALAGTRAGHVLQLLSLAIDGVDHAAVLEEAHRSILALAPPPPAPLAPVHHLVALGQVPPRHKDFADALVRGVVQDQERVVTGVEVPRAVRDVRVLRNLDRHGRETEREAKIRGQSPRYTKRGRESQAYLLRARLSRFLARRPAVRCPEVLVDVPPPPPDLDSSAAHRG